ncbi:MAG: cytochrome c biogenesis protein CcsA, partial [Phycisphaerales bacterium]
AWDPVENASLLPWLTSTALLHSMMVQQHRGMFKIWNVALIAMSFILCILGTYLTRSGVISSVHAFAASPISTYFLAFILICIVLTVWLILWRRGWNIALALVLGVTTAALAWGITDYFELLARPWWLPTAVLGALIGAAGWLFIWVWRQHPKVTLRSDHELEGLISREGAFLLGNFILAVMMFTTLVGTVFPLISGWLSQIPNLEQGLEKIPLIGEKIAPVARGPVTAGPPFYNSVVAPMGLLLAFVMAHGPVLAFGKTAALKIARAMTVPGIAGVIAAGTVLLLKMNGLWADSARAIFTSAQFDPDTKWAFTGATVSTIVTFIAVLGTFAVFVGFLQSTSARQRSTGENLLVAAIRLIDADKRRYGGQLVHLGMILVVLGVAGSSLYQIDKVNRLSPGESVEMAGMELTFVSLDRVRDVNFTAYQATVTARQEESSLTTTLRALLGVVSWSLPRDREMTTTLTPQVRYYDAWGNEPNSEVALRSTLRRDLYLTLAGWEAGGAIVAIEARVTPLVLWIWLGGMVMAGGGIFCAVPRLLPKPHRVPAVATRPGAAKREAESAAILESATLETEVVS